LAIAALVYFGAGRYGQQAVYLETYIDESVQGLNVGSPVKYRGIELGTVEEISFVAAEYDIDAGSEEFVKYGRYVMVVIAVRENGLEAKNLHDIKELLKDLIDNELRIRLTSQALTGVSYLDTDYLDPAQYPKMKIGWEPKHLYIPSAPSVLSTFTASAEKAFQTLGKIDIEHLADLAQDLLESLNTAIADAKIDATSKVVLAMLGELRETNKQMQAVLMNEGGKSATLPAALGQLHMALASFNEIAAGGTDEVDEILDNINEISSNIRQLSEDIKEHPSKLMFGGAPAKSRTVK
jgi:paraquat-inducible protein B